MVIMVKYHNNPKLFLLVSFLIIILLFVSACSKGNKAKTDSDIPTPEIVETIEQPVKSIEIITDFEGYHSYDVIDINVMIDSKKSRDNYYLAVLGIDIRGRPKINNLININLDKGMNKFNFTYRLPSCNTCAGIPAGTYVIDAELYYDNLYVLGDQVNISLEQ